MRRIRQDGMVEHLLYGDLVQHFKREKLSEEKRKTHTCTESFA